MRSSSPLTPRRHSSCGQYLQPQAFAADAWPWITCSLPFHQFKPWAVIAALSEGPAAALSQSRYTFTRRSNGNSVGATKGLRSVMRYLKRQLGSLYALRNPENEKIRLAGGVAVAVISGAVVVAVGLGFALVWPM